VRQLAEAKQEQTQHRRASRQFPTLADARMARKAPIEPKDIDAIIDYLISV
jgi:hypothetical protein